MSAAKYVTYTSFIAPHYFMSVMNTVHFTTRSNDVPLRRSTAPMFSITCRVSA